MHEPVLGLAADALGTDVVLERDHSWPHGESTVLEVRDAEGTPWIVKRVRRPEAFEREVRALRHWAPRLDEGMAPRLRAVLPAHSLLVTDRLPGRAGTASAPEEFRQAGRLIRQLHDAEPAVPDPDYPARATHDLDGWLAKVPGVAAADEIAFVRARIRLIGALPPVPAGPVHNDNQPRNWLTDGHGTVRLIDFGRAKRDLQLRDFERMRQQEWRGRPDLRAAFFEGYGRQLTDAEEQVLVCVCAVAALTTVLWARAHGDAAFEEHGRQALRRLRAAGEP